MNPKCFGEYNAGTCEDLVDIKVCNKKILKNCRNEAIKRGLKEINTKT